MSSTKGGVLKRFKQLLVPSPMMVGTIVSVFQNQYTIQLDFGGGMINARGEGYILNDRVYIRNGIIESKAPQRSVQIIEV